MHHMRIAQQISDEIRAQRPKGKAVTVRVGELLAVNSQKLVDLLEVLGHKKVSIKTLPSCVKCKCGYEGPAEVYHRNDDTTLFRCPKCHGQPAVLKGEKLELELK